MLSVDQINNLEAENQKLKSDLQAAVTQYNAVVNQNKDLQTELNNSKYILKQIWNIAEHQINFNANNTDITYTVNDIKKIQQKINEVLK